MRSRAIRIFLSCAVLLLVSPVLVVGMVLLSVVGGAWRGAKEGAHQYCPTSATLWTLWYGVRHPVEASKLSLEKET